MTGRPRLAVVVTLLTLASLVAGHAASDTTPLALAGQLLVALDDNRDPRFVETVIYMLRHDGDGAMGLVVNRPLAEVAAGELLARFGVRDTTAQGDIRVHYGGPVEPGRGVVLHTADRMLTDSQLVADGIAFTATAEMLKAIAAGKGPRRSLVLVGYAGWAPGQLEGELQRGVWATVPSDAAFLFEGDPERMWERALARRKLRI